jgi:hypothetical protein
MKSFRRLKFFLSADTNRAQQTSLKNFDSPANNEVWLLVVINIGFEHKGKKSSYARQ